jgi:hypothetical protein
MGAQQQHLRWKESDIRSFGYIGIINITTHSFGSDIGNGLKDIRRLGELVEGRATVDQPYD